MTKLKPMPSKEEVEKLFEPVAKNANLTPDMVKAMPVEQKWTLIQAEEARKKESKTTEGDSGKPQYWIIKLKAEPTPDVLREVTFHIQSKGVNWLEDFAKLGGISQLGEIFDNLLKKQLSSKLSKEEKEMKTLIVKTVDKIMNNQTGLDLVMSSPNFIKILTLSYNDKHFSDDSKGLVLKLLSFVCLIPGGHSIVSSAMSNYKEVHREKSRFDTLVKLTKETESSMLRVSYLTFINALCNAPSDIDVRIKIRKELENLSFNDVLSHLRKLKDDHPEVDQQLDIYYDEKSNDEDEVNQRFSHVGTTPQNDDIDWLYNKLKELNVQSQLTPYLKQLLSDLLGINPESKSGPAQWALSSRVIHQISLMRDFIGDEESTAKDAEGEFLYKKRLQKFLDNIQMYEVQDVLPLRQQIELSEEEVKKTKKKLHTTEIELEEAKGFKIKLVEIENILKETTNNLNTITQEKEALIAEKQALNVQLDKIQSELRVALKSSDDSEKVKQLTTQIATKDARIAELERLLKEKGESAPAGGVPSAPVTGGPPPPPAPPVTGGGPPPPPAPPVTGGGPPPAPPMTGGGPPPPPPPSGGGPPPPPPPGGRGPPPPPGMRGGGPPPPPGGGIPEYIPKVKPKDAVRTFNWNKMPAPKLKGTVFETLKIDEVDGFELDYTSIEEKFTAKKVQPKDTSAPVKEKPKVVNIIDGKTAQNLMIWLAKYNKKMTNDEICFKLRDLDTETFDASAVNGFSALMPSQDDLEQINNYLKEDGDFQLLGPAEQFAFSLSKITQYDLRVKCFKYYTAFPSKKEDIKPDIYNLDKCNKFIKDDERIKDIIKIMLQMGNFLNHGNKRVGGARGFTLDTLSSFADFKTTDNKSNMFEVLIEQIKDKKPNLIKFTKEELQIIEDGARVNLNTTESDFKTLNKDFEDAKGLAETIEVMPDADKFHSIWNEFSASARADLDIIQSTLNAAITNYNTVVVLFGEDPKKKGPDEFFTIWKNFINKIVEVSDKIDLAREKAEKEARRAAQKAAAVSKSEEPGDGSDGKGRGGAAIRGRGAGPAAGRGRGGRGSLLAPGENNDAVVNELFAKMKAGNVYRTLRQEDKQ
eukprot:TRINITY_DN613_c0_g3_i1.p1 TRINITY_DN613_c0_g3~~TRINITY_DN613_c0_g3_i1.p1  ORF type:complete len:1231 (-),score=370.74 TRINITY_DN613_c0_g3_i1:66-3344(-)